MYYCKNRLKKYKNEKEYEFDSKLRILNLEILEVIELNFKKNMILFFNENGGIKNNELYQEKYLEKTLNLISEKENYFKLEDRDIRLEYKKHNQIFLESFIDKLTFGEIIKIFRNLKIKYKKQVTYKYNIKNYDIFESFIQILKYVRNICSHQENLFNINGIFKVKVEELQLYFENNSTYLVYFFILSLFEFIILKQNTWQEKVLNFVLENVGIGKVNKDKKNNLPSQLESEAWKVLVQELYNNSLKKSNLSSKNHKIMKNFSIILATDINNGIGKNNDLCWRLNQDLKYFKETTCKTQDLGKLNAVIMGRKTWESIPSKFKPLPNRVNCILSRSLKHEDINSKIDNFVLYFNDFNHCLEELSKKENVENIFLIGGGSLYNQFINHPKLEKIYLTKVLDKFDCDTFFNGIPNNFVLESYSDELEENGIKFRFEVYKKI